MTQSTLTNERNFHLDTHTHTASPWSLWQTIYLWSIPQHLTSPGLHYCTILQAYLVFHYFIQCLQSPLFTPFLPNPCILACFFYLFEIASVIKGYQNCQKYFQHCSRWKYDMNNSVASLIHILFHTSMINCIIFLLKIQMCFVFIFFQRNLILQYFKLSISSNLALPLFLSVTLFPYAHFQLLIHSLNAF